MLARLAPLAAALLLAASCSDSPEASPTPSSDPVNAAACRAFDDGIRQLTELNAGARTPIAVGVAAETAHGKVTTASQMAAGPTAAEMTRAAAAIKLLQDKQKDFLQDGFTDEQEVSAVRAAVTGVARVCAGSGVTLQNRG